MEGDRTKRSKEAHKGQNPAGSSQHKASTKKDQIQGANEPWSSKETLKIIYCNARSIFSKINDLQALAEDKKPDLILITESWCNDDINPAILNIDNYTIDTNLRCDRKDTLNGIGGRLLVYCKQGLNIIPCEEKNSFNQITSFIVKGKGKETDLNVSLIYRSPNSNESNNDLLMETMKKTPKNSILIGDFNFPKINWSLEVGSDQKSRNFLDIIDETQLTQLVDFPTHVKGNILDLVLTNVPEKILNIDCLGNLGNSDHSIISVDIIYSATVSEQKEYIHDWNKGDTESLGLYFNSINWDEELAEKNTNESWNFFCDKVNEAVDKFIPKTLKNKSSKPRWLNKHIVRLARKKERRWKEYIENRTKSNYDAYKQAEKETKKSVQKAKRKNEKLLSKDQNLKGFHSYVKSKTKIKDPVGPLKQENKIITDPAQIAEILNKYFNSVFTNENTTNIPTPVPRAYGSCIETISFNHRRVADKIKTLKSSPAAGPDGFSSIFLQRYAEHLSLPLAIIFNRSMQSGTIPRQWRDANITPIFKKGGKGDPGNYRPISLTSVPCRIMESIIKEDIIDHLCRHSLIYPSQHGFMRRRSVLTNLLHFFEVVTSNVDEGLPMDVLYLDYSKAFDKVPHVRLIRKMEAHGIKKDLLNWIQNWLNNRRQRVIINGCKSDWLTVLSGVPQGSVLGPLAFIIFINDLDDAVKLLTILNKFADDSKAGHVIRSQNDQITLQNALNALCKWASDWGMQFNEKKCKVIHFGSRNIKYDYEMNGIKLDKSTCERDLGIKIDQTLKPSNQCAEAVRKAKVSLNSISRAFHYRDKKIFLRLYYQYVRSHLEYSTPAWSPWNIADCQSLEKVQEKAINMISGLKGETYEEKLKELGIQTLEDRRTRYDLIQTFKIISRTEDVEPSTWFKMVDVSRQRQTRSAVHHLNIQPERTNLEIRKHFYSNRVVEKWNNLPTNVKEAPNVNTFKSRYDATWKEV